LQKYQSFLHSRLPLGIGGGVSEWEHFYCYYTLYIAERGSKKEFAIAGQFTDQRVQIGLRVGLRLCTMMNISFPLGCSE